MNQKSIVVYYVGLGQHQFIVFKTLNHYIADNAGPRVDMVPYRAALSSGYVHSAAAGYSFNMYFLRTESDAPLPHPIRCQRCRSFPALFLPSSSGNLKELELESCTLASPSPPPQRVRAAACFCVHVYGQVSQTNRKPSVKYSQL